MSTRPLLVVAHEATRTGSVAVLLEVLRRVRGRLGRPVAVRLLASGPHADELRGLADIDEMGADPAVVLLNSAVCGAGGDDGSGRCTSRCVGARAG